LGLRLEEWHGSGQAAQYWLRIT